MGTGSIGTAAHAQSSRLTALKAEAVRAVDARATFTQHMVDQIFSYGELGFQEFETSRYLVHLLRENGFTVEEGIAGIPTAWVATWGSGKPVISLGTDIDDIPQASQMPGVACRAPIIAGAPGHGEGHNSGQAGNITAALVVKEIMERENISGTLQIWPGVAEELVGTKAYYVARRRLRGCGYRALFSCGLEPLDELAHHARDRVDIGTVHVRGAKRPRGRRAVARTKRC